MTAYARGVPCFAAGVTRDANERPRSHRKQKNRTQCVTGFVVLLEK